MFLVQNCSVKSGRKVLWIGGEIWIFSFCRDGFLLCQRVEGEKNRRRDETRATVKLLQEKPHKRQSCLLFASKAQWSKISLSLWSCLKILLFLQIHPLHLRIMKFIVSSWSPTIHFLKTFPGAKTSRTGKGSQLISYFYRRIYPYTQAMS